MIDHTGVTVSNVTRSKAFYRAALAPLGYQLLMEFEQFAYGAVELAHRYEYHDNGALRRVEIVMPEEDPLIKCFDEQGAEVADQDA